MPLPFRTRIKDQLKSIKNRGAVILGLRPALRPTPHSEQLIELGTPYGGWTIAKRQSLQRATVIFCGAGEDISFDVAFAKTFSANVIIVDPTPRAIQHYETVMARLGEPPTSAFNSTGKQAPDSYDLRGISPDQMHLVKKALWKEETQLKFYSPPVEEHVSHSISNYQHDYRTDTKFITVDATTLPSLVSEFMLSKIPLLKLDIEGAEIEVLHHMIDSGLYPEQIAVEYDELINQSKATTARIGAVHDRLLSSDYRLIFIDRRDLNFLYVRDA